MKGDIVYGDNESLDFVMKIVCNEKEIINITKISYYTSYEKGK